MREIERYEEEFYDQYPKVRKHPTFYIHKFHEEADETLPHIDPTKPPSQEYLDEQADLFLTWVGLNLSMGVSIETAMQAVDLKIDELIRRAEYASTQPDFRTGWDVAKWFPEKE